MLKWGKFQANQDELVTLLLSPTHGAPEASSVVPFSVPTGPYASPQRQGPSRGQAGDLIQAKGGQLTGYDCETRDQADEYRKTNLLGKRQAAVPI